MIKEGDTVFLEDESGKRIWATVAKGMVKVQSLGAVDGSRLIGLEDGSPVSIAGRGYTVFVPGAADLMQSLDRGAQIILPKDAATILFECDVKAGDRVIEVGAGSGGLTTALLHSVAPSGSVTTLELKEENAKRVLKNVSRTSLGDMWSYQIGDARDMGISYEGTADVVTMDMPDPWAALDNVCAFLRPGGRFCGYVPNTNQLGSLVEALRERGYADVRAMENIQRGMEVHQGGVRPSFEMLGHTGYLVFARKRATDGQR
ncbi:MAG: tRNA (adenine-N1)-methyltransferase [Candidatus Methanomethylophilaceae archaeon]|nr:tRNA (adenine-N1)-methyltransferase [Candidatus Methanomethylophilaceae archaeon]